MPPLFDCVVVWFSGILSLYFSTVNCMELAYPPFRGAGVSNDAEIFILFSFIFVVAEELVSLASNGKRTTHRSTRWLLPHHVHYDRARFHHFSSFFRFCLQFCFFTTSATTKLLLVPRRSTGITGESHESRNCDGNFIFCLRRSSKHSNSWKRQLRMHHISKVITY